MGGWMEGRKDGWKEGWKSRVKDCSQQSKIGPISSINFFQFAVVILHNEQSTSIEIYDRNT